MEIQQKAKFRVQVLDTQKNVSKSFSIMTNENYSLDELVRIIQTKLKGEKK